MKSEGVPFNGPDGRTVLFSLICPGCYRSHVIFLFFSFFTFTAAWMCTFLISETQVTDKTGLKQIALTPRSSRKLILLFQLRSTPAGQRYNRRSDPNRLLKWTSDLMSSICIEDDLGRNKFKFIMTDRDESWGRGCFKFWKCLILPDTTGPKYLPCFRFLRLSSGSWP